MLLGVFFVVLSGLLCFCSFMLFGVCCCPLLSVVCCCLLLIVDCLLFVFGDHVEFWKITSWSTSRTLGWKSSATVLLSCNTWFISFGIQKLPVTHPIGGGVSQFSISFPWLPLRWLAGTWTHVKDVEKLPETTRTEPSELEIPHFGNVIWTNHWISEVNLPLVSGRGISSIYYTAPTQDFSHHKGLLQFLVRNPNLKPFICDWNPGWKY